MADGHLRYCKECCRKRDKERYWTSRESRLEYEKKRAKTLERKEKQRGYGKKHNLLNPEKYKARQKLQNAVRDGRVKREPCMFCGKTKVQAHHKDYSKPFDVIWVCFQCHRENFTLPEVYGL